VAQDSAQLAGEIIKSIAEKLLIQVSSPEEDLLGSGVLDSLTLVQLLFELEQRFRISIPLEELEIEDFRSVSAITRLVQGRMATTQPIAFEVRN